MLCMFESGSSGDLRSLSKSYHPILYTYWHVALWSLIPTFFEVPQLRETGFLANHLLKMQTFFSEFQTQHVILKCSKFIPRFLAYASWIEAPGRCFFVRPLRRLWRAEALQPRRGPLPPPSGAASCLGHFPDKSQEGMLSSIPVQPRNERWMFWTQHLENYCSNIKTFTNTLNKFQYMFLTTLPRMKRYVIENVQRTTDKASENNVIKLLITLSEIWFKISRVKRSKNVQCPKKMWWRHIFLVESICAVMYSMFCCQMPWKKSILFLLVPRAPCR